MKLNSYLKSFEILFKDFVKESLNRYGKHSVITDIYIQPQLRSGELIIFNDDDDELAKVIINDWATYERENFYDKVEKLLISFLNDAKEKGMFDDLPFLTPYNFVLVDEDKETITELLMVDDDTLLVNEELLKGLDKELDEFLKDLLSEY